MLPQILPVHLLAPTDVGHHAFDVLVARRVAEVPRQRRLLLLRHRRRLVLILPATIRAEERRGHHDVLGADLARGFEVGPVTLQPGHDLLRLRALAPARPPRLPGGLLRVGAGPLRVRLPERLEESALLLFASPLGGDYRGGYFLFFFFFFFLLCYFSFFFFFFFSLWSTSRSPAWS